MRFVVAIEDYFAVCSVEPSDSFPLPQVRPSNFVEGENSYGDLQKLGNQCNR